MSGFAKREYEKLQALTELLPQNARDVVYAAVVDIEQVVKSYGEFGDLAMSLLILKRSAEQGAI